MNNRKFDDSSLIIATHNTGKLREIRELLVGRNIQISSAAEHNLPEPEETEDSFTGNAILKARAAALASNMPALADDSGLVVPALDGAPGIYSARWAGPDKDFSVAMSRIERELQERAGKQDEAMETESINRDAYFVCALSLVWPDGHDETFVGRVDGTLAWPPRGERGFGYDPIFIANGYDITFGEMDPDLKHRIGHRADAFSQIVAACFDR